MALSDEARPGRYGATAIALHWLIALMIIANLGLAWRFEMLEDGAARGALIRLHKSIGITVLLLSVVRLAWRLAHRPPPLPASLGALERGLARFTHAAFYGLMILLPLSGWAMISAADEGRWPTRVWGLFTLPFIAPVAQLGPDSKAPVHAVLGGSHLALGLVMAALIVLHVAGALKHTVLDRDGVAWRMAPLPWLAGRRPEA